MYISNEKNKPINFNLVVGAFIYIIWKCVQISVGDATIWDIVDLIGSALAFICVLYLGAMRPTVFGLVKSFLIVIFELIGGKISKEDAIHRLEILIKEAVALWNSLYVQKKTKIPVEVKLDEEGKIVPRNDATSNDGAGIEA